MVKEMFYVGVSTGLNFEKKLFLLVNLLWQDAKWIMSNAKKCNSAL